MSGPVGSSTWFGTPGYDLDQSLRFEDGRASNLTRTPASAGNRRTFTYSCWVKRGTLGLIQALMSVNTANNNSNILHIYIAADDEITISFQAFTLTTTPVLRDPSAWYHIMFVADTTQATEGNRFKIYLNGTQLTLGSSGTFIAQNTDLAFNQAGIHQISGRNEGNRYFDGYMAELHLIDGAALGPENFGTTDEHGAWTPKEFAGAHGTNGFYLPFKQDYTVEGFSTVTWDGNTLDQYIGGVGFQPDFVWIKHRNGAGDHMLMDSIRGVTKNLLSNATTAEETRAEGLQSFQSDGFTLGTNDGNLNRTARTYVGWNWDMGGSNANDTSGTINSVVRANASYGQSIVSYTGNGSANQTVGHGLSAIPELVIIKAREYGSGSWTVYHSFSSGNPSSMFLNSNGASESGSGGTSTTSVIGIQTGTATGGDSTNRNNEGFIAYVFHSVTGYSKIGSYTGNGNSTGPVVATGFAPAFVLTKGTSGDMTHQHWTIRDNTRGPSKGLQTNLAQAEFDAANNNMTFTSTGFNILGTDPGQNNDDETYIYMAFADKREYAYWLDQSGNNNDWTSNNLTESDIMVDSPTNNFCTWNPLTEGINGVLPISSGNLEVGTRASGSSGDGNKQTVKGTLGVSSGKWYLEFCKTNATGDSGFCGVGSSSINIDSTTPWNGSPTNALVVGQTVAGFRINDGKVFTKNGTNDGITTATGVSVALGTIYAIAFNLDDDEADFYVNGSQVGSTIAFTVASDDVIVPLISQNTTWELNGFVMNCGQDSSFAALKVSQGNTDSNGEGDFFYAPPSGFLALCTNNLPEPLQSGNFFKALAYTGTGTGQVISGVGFKPDFLWAKRRDNDYGHVLLDIARGFGSAGNDSRLQSDAVDVASASPYVASLNDDGYVTENAQQSLNIANGTYVGWHWKAGSGNTAVAESGNNPGGTHNANQAAGFSIVKYVGTGANGAVTHGLGAIPEVILIKNIGVNDEWYVYYGDETDYLVLNDTDATADSAAFTNDTDPTSSVFTVSTSHSVNADGENYIAYCWRSVPGFSQIGSYPGNADANGAFIHTGFKPAFVMNKAISRTGNWMMTDSARSPTNVNGVGIFANAVAREYSDANTNIDLLSNGFKWRTADDNNNDISETYFYMAFAEVPFKYTTAR